jgi:calcineurin-like phosphoesterase family protein
MIHFTSDTHFWHNAVIGYCNRPWETREEMNEGLIQRWNEKIGGDDEVYFLGDFAFCGTQKARDILERLQGRKFWIRGNHDYGLSKKIDGYFEWVRDYYLLKVHDVHQDEEDETKFHQYHQPIVLCHFPILSWDGLAHGSWHLHGHCHGSLPTTKMKRMDVGVDTNNWYPYSYQDIKTVMIWRGIGSSRIIK